MRIRVTGQGAGNSGGLGTLDPPPPLDIRDIFEIEFLRASANGVKPFEEVSIEWSIKELKPEDFPFSDYLFTLTANGEDYSTDIPAASAVQYTTNRNTSFRLVARRRGTGNSSIVGQEFLLWVDESGCEVVEVPSRLVDGMVSNFAQVATATSSLRMRKRAVPTGGGLNVTWEEMEVEPTWHSNRIGYFFPLEVVINNFFNANLDVRINVAFKVHHDADDTDLEVVITHESSVDFDTFETIVSLGHASTAAKTANRLIPLILSCEAPAMERTFLRGLLQWIDALGPGAETHRLWSVRIDPTENFSYIKVVLCPRPVAPDDDDLVVIN